MRSLEADGRLVFFNQIKTQYERAAALQKTVTDYRLSLDLLNSSPLLEKSLTLGEISLTEYLLEISVKHESIRRMLETERDLYKELAGLMRYSD